MVLLVVKPYKGRKRKIRDLLQEIRKTQEVPWKIRVTV